MSNARTTKHSLLIIGHISHVRSQAERLIEVADLAAAMHRADILLDAGNALYRLNQYEASRFYQALAIRRATGQQDAARAILSEIAERGSELFRAKALVTLGTFSYHIGDYSEARSLYAQARRLSSSPLVYLHTSEMAAMIASANGDHHKAVRILSETLPVALRHGLHGLNHRNSLAVELNEIGRADEARYYLAPCLSSPYLSAYPEWLETAQELPQATRSIVATAPAVPDNSAEIRAPVRLAMNLLNFSGSKKTSQADDEKQIKLYLSEAREFMRRVHPATPAEAKQYVELIKETWNKKDRWDGLKKLLSLPKPEWDKVIEKVTE